MISSFFHQAIVGASEDHSLDPPPSKKTLRSTSAVRQSSHKPVLEKVCVVCGKANRYISVKSKTVRDKLMQAETVNAGKY